MIWQRATECMYDVLRRSLLAFTRGRHGQPDRFRYFDSLGTRMAEQAKIAATRLAAFVESTDPGTS